MSSILSNVSDWASQVSRAVGGQGGRYADPSDTIAQVFSNLDSEGKGYLDATDFQAAFESLGIVSSDEGDGSLTGAGAEAVVSVLDVDGDGRVTSGDMTQGLQALTDSLGVLRGRESGAGPEALGGAPPPPTPEQVLGFTEAELTDQYATLTAAGAADSDDPGTQLLASILAQFETADADGDGRVSGEEAMAFAQALDEAGADEIGTAATAASTTTEAATSAAPDTGSAEQLVMRRIMALVDAYGASDTSGGASDLLSELA